MLLSLCCLTNSCSSDYADQELDLRHNHDFSTADPNKPVWPGADVLNRIRFLLVEDSTYIEIFDHIRTENNEFRWQDGLKIDFAHDISFTLVPFVYATNQLDGFVLYSNHSGVEEITYFEKEYIRGRLDRQDLDLVDLLLLTRFASHQRLYFGLNDQLYQILDRELVRIMSTERLNPRSASHHFYNYSTWEHFEWQGWAGIELVIHTHAAYLPCAFPTGPGNGGVESGDTSDEGGSSGGDGDGDGDGDGEDGTDEILDEFKDCREKQLSTEARELLMQIQLGYITDVCGGRTAEELLEAVMTELCRKSPGEADISIDGGNFDENEVPEKDMIEKEDILNSTAFENINTSVNEAILAARKLGYSSPCNPDESVVDAAIAAMNENGDCSTAGFQAALDGVDKIIESSAFANCLKVKCVYDLLDNSNNGLFCSTFGDLFDTDDFNLTLDVGNRFSDVSGGDGSTSVSGTEIVITIANDLCNGDEHPLQIAGTLLHEAIHASMYQEAKLVNSDVAQDDYCSIWQAYFETSDPCHEVMANQYVNHLAQAIADLDENRFPVSHYLKIAWEGLEGVGSQLGLLTDPYASQYSSEHNILINESFSDCN